MSILPLHQPFPQYLTIEEMANPYTVINEFLTGRDLHINHWYISHWMFSVNSERGWYKEVPCMLLAFYEEILALIEAVWLIQKEDNSDKDADLSSKEVDISEFMDIEMKKKPSDEHFAFEYFPRFLTRKEYLNPYKVLTKFFKVYTLEQWKQELHSALHVALSECNLEDSGYSIDVLKIKTCLDKLVDACRIISIREEEV